MRNRLSSKGSVINQSWSTQFPVATFSQITLLGSCTTCYASATCEWSYVNAKVFVSSIFTNGHFYLSTTFSIAEISPQRYSANCQLLSFFSRFSFTKILKAQQVLIFITFWRNVPRLAYKCYLLTSTDQR